MTLSSEFLALGHIVREPVGKGQGYWAGAPGSFYDTEERAFYLTYRLRRPRGVEPDRGGEAFIARSADGLHFDDVLRVTKDRFASTSIEKCALRRGPDGLWRYFLSTVAPEDSRWCVSVLRASTIDGLASADVERVFTATELDVEGVKDPWIFEHDGTFHMILSVAVMVPETSEQSHATADIYNTGECKSATALATSADLDRWTWRGVVFAPGDSGWDRYARRINSVVATGEGLVAFYDGAESHLGNYEERTGLAASTDLESWRCLTPGGPALVSANTSGSLRYVDAIPVGDDLFLYYEFARVDGSHDLRVVRTTVNELPR